MNIKFLPEETIRKISAGEFISRPYLVLKELLENSLDANSSKIKIEICKYGLDLIRVIDNGFGIDKFNLFLSIKRHTTSKIFFFDDLYNLNTFGFRGEALSSISSISCFSISSRFKKDKFGWILSNSKNNVLSFKIFPLAHNVGTIVSVKKLFFNFYVRRNKLFLMRLNEWFFIKNIVNNFVLSNVNVEFTIYKDKKLYKKFLSDIDNKNILFNRFISIYGNNFFDNYIYININNNYIVCNGYFFFNRSCKDIKIIYLNKRIISNSNLLYFIVNKFILDFYLNKNYFSYVLFFYISYKEIDINIYPDKRKINFLNSSLLINIIYNDFLIFFKKNKLNIKKNFFLKLKKEVNNDKCNYFNFFNEKYFFQYFFEKFGNIIGILNKRFLCSFNKNNLILSDLFYIYYYMNIFIFKKKLFFLISKKKTTLLKVKVKNIFILNREIKYILFFFGWNIIYEKKFIYIKSVPTEFFNINFEKLFYKFMFFFYKIKNSYFILNKIIYWLSNYLIYSKGFSNHESIFLISKFHKICVYYKFYKKVFYSVNLNKLLLLIFDDIWI